MSVLAVTDLTYLQFSVVKNDKQYDEYCKLIYEIMCLKKRTAIQEDALDLLSVLVEQYDEEQRDWEELNPVELLKAIMDEWKFKAVDLAKELDVSKSLVSDILNYRRGFSKEMIRKLAERFKMDQSAFNRPYWLKDHFPAEKEGKKVVRSRNQRSRSPRKKKSDAQLSA